MLVELRCLTAAAFASASALLIAGCDPGPDPLPIHSEVTWQDGREPSGEYENLEYVRVAREWNTQYLAALNALNFSDESLARTSAHLEGVERAVAENVQDGILSLWKGPTSFTVLSVREVGSQVRLEVCASPSIWWTRSEVQADEGLVFEDREGVRKYERAEYGLSYFDLVQAEDGYWRVVSGPIGDRGEIVSCDPGEDVAVGVFATPPDLGLLHDATPDMAIGPDGRRAG